MLVIFCYKPHVPKGAYLPKMPKKDNIMTIGHRGSVCKCYKSCKFTPLLFNDIIISSMKLIFTYLFCLLICLGIGRHGVWAQELPGWRLSTSQPIDTFLILKKIEQAEVLKESLPDSAFHLLREVFRDSRKKGFKKGILIALLHLGNLQCNAGLYDSALFTYKNTLNYCTSEEDFLKAYTGIAGAYNFMGRGEEAMTYYLKAIASLKTPVSTEKQALLVPLYSKLSTVLHFLNQNDKALYYINKALPIAQLQQNYYMQSKLFNMKGVCYFYGRRDPEKALKYLDTAIALARQINSYEALHPALVNKGTIYTRNGQPKEALALLSEGKKLSREFPVNLNDQVGNISALGEAYLKLKKYKEAEDIFMQAWTYANLLPREKHFLSFKLAELYAETGHYQKAFSYQKVFMALSDTFHNKQVITAISDIETRYRTAEKDMELMNNQLLIKTQQEKLARKNLWLVLSAGGGIIGILLITGFFYHQKQKNKLLISRQKIEQLHAKIEGEEEERKRLARELHDGINSQIAGAKSYLVALGNLFPFLKETTAFKETGTILNHTASDIRRVAHNLLPTDLTGHSLAEALHSFCHNLSSGNKLEIELHPYGNFATSSPALALSIYRIAQELLHNIIKHAQATEAIVLLNENKNEISLIVEDNGIGMDNNVNAHKGMGLESIRSRVKAHSGTFHLESAPGKGTVVSIYFPIGQEEKNMEIDVPSDIT